MDPQVNLTHQGWLLKQLDICKGSNRRRNLETDLTELRQALYDWIRDGGFEPDWSREPRASEYFGKGTPMAKKDRKSVKKVLETGSVVTAESENISDSNANNALLPAGTQEQSVLSDPPFIEEKESRTVATITLKYKGTQKNGIHTFSDESRGASVYVNKSMFADGARPDSLTIEAPDGVFAEPGSGRVSKAASPEKLAKQEAAAAKAQERAAKAQERAEKAAKSAERLRTALGQPAQNQPSA